MFFCWHYVVYMLLLLRHVHVPLYMYCILIRQLQVLLLLPLSVLLQVLVAPLLSGECAVSDVLVTTGCSGVYLPSKRQIRAAVHAALGGLTVCSCWSRHAEN
jgi:hypothetical protein